MFCRRQCRLCVMHFVKESLRQKRTMGGIRRVGTTHENTFAREGYSPHPAWRFGDGWSPPSAGIFPTGWLQSRLPAQRGAVQPTRAPWWRSRHAFRMRTHTAASMRMASISLQVGFGKFDLSGRGGSVEASRPARSPGDRQLGEADAAFPREPLGEKRYRQWLPAASAPRPLPAQAPPELTPHSA
jgi:hypothetical protein